MTTTREDQRCKCGRRVRWLVDCEPHDVFGIEVDYDMVTDVTERPCPHRNGTVIQHCPNCDRIVGMWGAGPINSMECDCWDYRRPSITDTIKSMFRRQRQRNPQR